MREKMTLKVLIYTIYNNSNTHSNVMKACFHFKHCLKYFICNLFLNFYSVRTVKLFKMNSKDIYNVAKWFYFK